MDERSTGQDRPSGDAAVTGVARGALGTGTNLDETQEWVIPPELQAGGPAVAPSDGPADAPADARAPHAAAAADPSADASPARAAAAADAPAPVMPVASDGVAARRSPGSGSRGRGFSASPRTAGIAAVILLALVAATAVVTSMDPADSGGLGIPPAAEQATIAPTEAPPAEAGGNGGGKKDKGNGNGRGNGNGGGHGND